MINLKLFLSQIFLVAMSQSLILEQPKKIRIIHRGEEIKPIGTIWIMVGTCSPPDDRELDNIFGRCVKVNQSDFNVVSKFFKKSKTVTNDISELINCSDYYEIDIQSSNRLFLKSLEYQSFVKEWRTNLIEEKVDRRLVDLFQ